MCSLPCVNDQSITSPAVGRLDENIASPQRQNGSVSTCRIWRRSCRLRTHAECCRLHAAVDQIVFTAKRIRTHFVRPKGIHLTWFNQLMGFDEQAPHQVPASIDVNGNRMLSRVNGREFGCGSLEILSLAALRSRIAKSPLAKGRL